MDAAAVLPAQRIIRRPVRQRVTTPAIRAPELVRRAAAVRAAVQPAKVLTVHTAAAAVHAILVLVPVLPIAAVHFVPVQKGIIILVPAAVAV